MLMTCQLALCSIFAHCCPHSTYQGTESENYISYHVFLLEEWGGTGGIEKGGKFFYASGQLLLKPHL